MISKTILCQKSNLAICISKPLPLDLVMIICQFTAFIFRKRDCFRNKKETTAGQPAIGEDGYVEYKKNTEGDSYTVLKRSNPLDIKIADETNEDLANMDGNQPYYFIPNEGGSDEKPKHIKHTYFNPTKVDAEVNKEAVYSTIPENEPEGKADGDYSYAYADMPNRDTISGAGKKENSKDQYVNASVLHK